MNTSHSLPTESIEEVIERTEPTVENVRFTPFTSYLVVLADPIERSSESGLDLSLAESLDANFPLSGTVVAAGEFAAIYYDVGDHVMFRRYAGIQVAFNGNPNYWILEPAKGELLGRFDTAPRGESQE